MLLGSTSPCAAGSAQRKEPLLFAAGYHVDAEVPSADGSGCTQGILEAAPLGTKTGQEDLASFAHRNLAAAWKAVLRVLPVKQGSVWGSLEQHMLCGPRTRLGFENFVLGKPAVAWQVLHLALCLYHSMFPPRSVGELSEGQIRLLFGLFTVLCVPWLFVVCLPGYLLHDKVIVEAVEDSTNTELFGPGHRYDGENVRGQVQMIALWVPVFCLFPLLLFAPEPLLLFNVATLSGIVIFVNAYMFFFRLVEKLSHERIEKLRKEIAGYRGSEEKLGHERIEEPLKEIEGCKGSGSRAGAATSFWPEVTQKHLDLDDFLQRLWKAAMPVYASFFAVIGVSLLILGLMLLRQLHSKGFLGAVLAASLMSCAAFYAMTILREVASVTDACMSKAAMLGDCRSIYREALKKCGDGRMSLTEAQQHQHFLNYLSWNPAGVKLGVTIDNALVLKVAHPLVVVFSCLFSFLISTLRV